MKEYLLDSELTLIEKFTLFICENGLSKEALDTIPRNSSEKMEIQNALKSLADKELVVLNNGIAYIKPENNEHFKYIYCVLRKKVRLEDKKFLFAFMLQISENNPFTGKDVAKLKKTKLDRFDLNSRDGIKELINFIRN